MSKDGFAASIKRLADAFWHVIKGRRLQVFQPGYNEVRNKTYTSQTNSIVLDFIKPNKEVKTQFPFSTISPADSIEVECNQDATHVKYKMASWNKEHGKWNYDDMETHAFSVLADDKTIFDGPIAYFEFKPSASSTLRFRVKKYEPEADV